MSHSSSLPVLVIFGPTASGKTALADIFFSEKPSIPIPEGISALLNGRAEIISADSMQVYRGMDIGTAKPDRDFRKKLPHHLIDICDPDEQFCAGDFVRLADAACGDIFSRGKMPVVLGGTAFYIKNFLFGLPETPQADAEVRKKLQERAEKEGIAVLLKELEAIDPVSARRIGIHDEYRIIRALEIYAASGKAQSSFDLPCHFRTGYLFRVISLDRAREELYRRIDSRVQEMVRSGLAGEVSSLVRSGYTAESSGLRAIGYREFFAVPGAAEKMRSGQDLSDTDIMSVQNLIQRNSRKYAKRQETFIRPMSGVRHIPADDIMEIYNTVTEFYNLSGLCGTHFLKSGAENVP
ncbi:tRNA (adenosine(37)-N6)-dimethylallyltransferase MiaA [Brucepastera parasyntrophica]|uniref:tRNA (adenosine(37)-N6)-dimethylallyltransferase MiaA n=1 Tax=Brucepastera parasyntrophica TaxID=2880008 RepID=UPI00210C3F8A|nr:tRNA (adenosine(37)-N6)-dimethylallyltransferase MiaA [Brucepastera parasyntrophica]ULQ59707.1 tRNA (adenosine(37)-N6)-dimethylallyltransferase MiaA [Brucepastera parasyntrophica]